MKFVAILLSLLITGSSIACSMDGKSGFLPKNDLYIPVGMKSLDGGLNSAEFHRVISKVERLYSREVASMGGKLVINRSWTDGEVNAFASREGKNWMVTMTGGLARHNTITEDGLALVVCHELGHHIGGAPKKVMGNAWASSEGQSDYFAALKCLRHVFLNDNNEKIVEGLGAPAYVKANCTRSHGRADRDICVRIAMAGMSVAKLFQSLSGEKAPAFNTPDSKKVAVNDDRHPATQCRLDTFYQGALCERSMNEDVSQTDEVKGTCHPKLGDRRGLRPSCWFKAKK